MQDMAQARDRSTVQGVLERIVYLNEEDGFTVARLQVSVKDPVGEGEKDLVTVVGHMPGVNPGESLRLEGRWVVDKKFGEQFRVESWLSMQPATLTGIQKYLGSGLIRGIGPIMAKRLVERFGLETLEVIEREPERLLEVDGIGPIRSERITRAWEEQKEIRQVMIFLQGCGVNTCYAVKIYKRYSNQAILVLKENPYRLATEISGIGFKTADRIAQNMGIDPHSRIRAEAGLLYSLSQLVDEGHVCYPQDQLLEKTTRTLEIERGILEGALDSLARQEKVTIEEWKGAKVVYLTPLRVAEENTAKRLRELLRSPKQLLQIDVEAAIEWVQGQTGIELAEMQKEAIRKAIEGKVLVLTGGPGTGKTTLVNSLIRILEKKRQRIVLASPTARAAKRLAEVTGREAKTIHRLLEYSPREGEFKRNDEKPLQADLVVIDEASMVDILLMNHLLKAIPPSATLVLVGDVDQLPSVGPGNVLRDIIESGTVETVRLTEIFRQAQKSLLVVNAHRVNRGEFPRTDRGGEGLSDFYFMEREDPEMALKTIKQLCAERIPEAFGLNPLDEIQVITPMHRGVVGVTNLNRELQNLLNPAGEEIVRGGRRFRLGDKVMQIRNNYEKEVFNGEIGRIAQVDLEDQQMWVEFDGRRISYDWSEFDDLVLAYAISIHKSQGNEYPAVVVPILTQHYVMLQRNLLYTAITRAKKLAVLVGTKKAIAIAVRNDKVQRRYTHLREKVAGPSSTEKSSNIPTV